MIKKFLVMFALAMLMILLGANALAAMPDHCPECGSGYKEGWSTGASDQEHHMKCWSCGYYYRVTHTSEAPCEVCGWVLACKWTFTQLENNQHLAKCSNSECLQGYGGEGKVLDCQKNRSCYALMECYDCKRKLYPSENNHRPELTSDESGHYYQCYNYGRTGYLTCTYKTEPEPHSYVKGICSVCDYLDPSAANKFLLSGYELGANAEDIEVFETYPDGEIFTSMPESYILVKDMKKYTGKIELDTEYWLAVVVDNWENFEVLDLNVPFTEAWVIEESEIFDTICFRLVPFTLPETGDGANIALWLSMLAASIIGLFALSRRGKSY